jgi:hypothetical protein
VSTDEPERGRLRRIIFETSSPAVLRSAHGPDVPGTARCVAWLVEPADNAFGRDHPASVWSVRQRVDVDAALRISPPPPEVVGAEEAAIPGTLIHSLPEDALLATQWEFRVGRAL